MKKILLSFCLLLFGFIYSQHKFLETPKLSDEDLKREKSEKYPDAPAEVLYRSIHFRVDYDGYIYKDVTDRVKIYNKDNASTFLDHQISIYKNSQGKRETLSDLKAFTSNWEDGKKVTTKIERDEKYQSKEDKNYTITKFAFPNVKNGSVVEFSYSLYSPFIGSTPRILIEDEIPIKYIEYVFDTPKLIGYSINYNGKLNPSFRETGDRIMYGSDYNIYRFAYENVPPYKEEKYVLNNDNYKTGIKSELNSIFLGAQLKSYTLTWKDVSKRLYENDNFGEELRKKNLVKDLLPIAIKEIPLKSDRARAILKFVQKNYTWNKDDDVVTDKGIKNLLTNKIGNTAELNILLILLLRSADIDANPIVLSTVKRGMLAGYLPSMAQLNFVMASYVEGKKFILLDATSKQSDLNMISPRALNYYGFYMPKDDASQINIVFPEVSKTILSVNAKMNADGTFEGSFADRDTKLYAMMVNESFLADKEKYAKTYKDLYKFPYSNFKQSVQENNDFETSFDFTSDTFTDVLGSKMVFNPLLFLYSQNHDFDQKEPRKAPLEFYSAYDRNKKVTITIPDNYVFENVPKSKKFRTDDNALQYTYLVTQEGNRLTVETSVQIDDAVFPAEYYPAFTQIYDNITKMEAQVVTAVKK
ncbi:DUF3857 domain-containing protein [Kaistella jeonii]|uniref:Uncharacterized protein n=1 Tax=Kaistella jeonii TaxID=266749 RepID=A0A0C1F8B5_9FLAO|nr:DUF3857 domain-containing protein [Kaistella jeonii]KIA88128.1 hypothetical protein OA86_12300 [Kaistella jeonii]SFC28785.1 protein of unknown function [Kaistella jeonii]VEI96911.1 Uncharacterised protein [Kaistella jeonii]